MRNLLRILILLAFVITPAGAVESRTVLDAIDLNNGDTVVFAGDSITHQCLYTQYVEDFFYTRYPDRRLRFHNAGIGGDKAFDALQRFERDIAAYKPKYVTFLLGMNDGTYADFSRDVFDTYERDMTSLLDKTEAVGATAIVMSPTMFDHVNHTSRLGDPTYRGRTRERSPYYNAVLAFYGAWLREMAFQRGLGYVNMWGPLNDLTLAQRKSAPTYTLVPDSIHPAESGQLVMAFAILSELCPDRPEVSAIDVIRSGARWSATASGGEVGNVSGSGSRLEFTFLARSLPWVVPSEAGPGFRLCEASRRLGSESLRVAGLEPGSYQIRIDGKPSGPPISHVQLGSQVHLESNPLTPQYQQALKVAILNQERNQKAVQPLRDLWRKPKQVWRATPLDPVKVRAAIQNIEAEIKTLEARALEYERKIYATAQPRSLRYEIIRVAPD